MAYDEALADRIRHVLKDNDTITERRMFGGLCFLANGHMCCGIVGDRLMARINKAEYAQVLEQPHVREMTFTGRPLSGFVYVEPEGIESARALRAWIAGGLEIAAQSEDGKKKPQGSARNTRPQGERKSSGLATGGHTRTTAKAPVAKPLATRPAAVKPQDARSQVTTSASKTSAPPAGYSGTPLAKKLGIVSGASVATFGAPENYADLLAPLPDAVRFVKTVAAANVLHVFTTRKSELADRLARLYPIIQPDAAVWVSWPKKASKVPTDITEDVIRNVALPLGFVDVKVCAVDDVWSGLKLVIRVANRKTRR